MLSILAGLSILMIGDSHLSKPDYLIGPLHDNLLMQGAQVHSVGVCGSIPGNWLAVTAGACGSAERVGKSPAVLQTTNAATKSISSLIAAEKPALVVIVMGDTIAAYDKPDFPKTWAWQQTTALVKAISATGTACAWVGPSWGTEGGRYGRTYARVELMSKFLAANVAPCRYIDSLSMSKRGQWPTADGQHLSPGGYKQWADAIAQSLKQR